MNEASDYDESFQRMVAGYSDVYVRPGYKTELQMKTDDIIDFDKKPRL